MAVKEKTEPIIVAQIMGKMNGGGVESVIMNYYRHIDRSKVQFDFICDEDSTNIPYEEIEKLGGHVILCPPYQKLPKYLKFLKQLFREKKYAIVHSNINTLSVFPLRAAKKAGIKVRIAHSHSTSNPKEVKRNLIKNILRIFSKRYATDYFACSETAGRYQFGDKAVDNGKVKIIQNAIDVDKFRFDPEARKKLRKEIGIAEGDFVTGHVGRFVRVKNHEFLIDVFAEVKKEKKNAKLVLVGQGPLREEIKQKVKFLGLEKDVYFVGQRNDVNKLYSVFDVFVLPSLYEGFGMVAVEAQCNGLPVVMSNKVPKEAALNENAIFSKNKTEKYVRIILSATRRNINETEKTIDVKYQNNNLANSYIERRRINVLIFGMTPTHGGIETCVKNYVDVIDRNKFNIVFMNNYDEGFYFKKYFEEMNIKAYDVANYRKHPLKFMRQATRIIKNEKIDIVHYNMNSAVYLHPLIVAKICGVSKIISHAHSSMSDKGFVKEILHRTNKKIIPLLATDYFSCSLKSSEWFYSKKIIDSPKHVIIPNAIDVDLFGYDAKNRKLIRKELGINDNKYVIGHVGRFVEIKNHKFLLEAFSKLNKQNDNTVLLLVGDGPLLENMKELARKLDLGNNIIFAGARNDINKIYSAMDLFVLPSKSEGLPLVTIEAQSSNLQEVVTKTITKEIDITSNIRRSNNELDEFVKTIEFCRRNRTDRSKKVDLGIFDIRKSVKILEAKYER